MTFYFLAAILFSAGVASAIQAIKNSRTSSDLETGRWFLIGLLFIAIGGVIWAVLLMT